MWGGIEISRSRRRHGPRVVAPSRARTTANRSSRRPSRSSPPRKTSSCNANRRPDLWLTSPSGWCDLADHSPCRQNADAAVCRTWLGPRQRLTLASREIYIAPLVSAEIPSLRRIHRAAVTPCDCCTSSPRTTCTKRAHLRNRLKGWSGTEESCAFREAESALGRSCGRLVSADETGGVRMLRLLRRIVEPFARSTQHDATIEVSSDSRLTPHVSRIQTTGDGGVGGAFDNRAAVGK